MIDRATEIDHSIDRMYAHRRQAAARRFLSMRPPRGWFQQQGIRKRHRCFDMQDRSQSAGADATTKFGHLRVKTAIVAEPQSHARLARGLNGGLRVCSGERERFFAEDMFVNMSRGNDLLRMHRM